MTTVQITDESWALVFGLLVLLVQANGDLAIGLLQADRPIR